MPEAVLVIAWYGAMIGIGSLIGAGLIFLWLWIKAWRTWL